jgi:hypothetical protein
MLPHQSHAHHNSSNQSPFEVLFKCSPDYSFLRTFSCLCWPNLRPYNTNKFQPRSVPCLFLGYSTLHKGYKYLHLPTNLLYISRDVVFTESTFPYTFSFSSETSSPNSRQPFSLPFLSYPLAASVPQPSTTSIPSATPLLSTPLQSPQSESVTSVESSFVPIIPEVSSPPSAPLESVHPMVTRAKHNISKPREFADGRVQYPIPRALLVESSSLIIEPTCQP